jgi:hypothetical protein
MAILTMERERLSDWLAWEGLEGGRTAREQVTLLSSTTADTPMTSGMVLGRIAASGKLTQINFAAVDGSQTAAGILGPDVTVPQNVDTQSWMIDRMAVVVDSGLTWPAGATVPNIAAGIAALKALGIVIRTGA